MYSIPWEAESNFSLLNHSKVNRHPEKTEHTDIRDSATQQFDDESCRRKHKNATDSIADAAQSDTQSSQGYVNAPKTDTRILKDAPIENEGTSNISHGSNLRHDTNSTTSTEVNSPTDQNDKTIQDEFIHKPSRGAKYNLQSKANLNFSISYRNKTGAKYSSTTTANIGIDTLSFFFGFSIFCFLTTIGL